MSIRTVYNRLHVPVLSATLAGVMAISSAACTLPQPGQEPAAAEHTTQAQSADSNLSGLSAEQIYAGIFFGSGPASTLLPEFFGEGVQYSPAMADPKQMIPMLEDAAQKADESGDARNAALIRSVVKRAKGGELPGVDGLTAPVGVAELFIAHVIEQDPMFFQTFEAGIRSGDPIAVEAALKYAAQLTTDAAQTLLMENAVTPSEKSLCVFAAVVLVAAGAVALALVLWSVVVVVEGFWVATASASANSNQLMHDEIIARVTSAFGPAQPGAPLAAQPAFGNALQPAMGDAVSPASPTPADQP